MSSKDYEAIARAIRECVGVAPSPNAWTKGYDAGLADVAWRLCDVLEADNERFQRARFLEACGVAAMATIASAERARAALEPA